MLSCLAYGSRDWKHEKVGSNSTTLVVVVIVRARIGIVKSEVPSRSIKCSKKILAKQFFYVALGVGGGGESKKFASSNIVVLVLLSVLVLEIVSILILSSHGDMSNIGTWHFPLLLFIFFCANYISIRVVETPKSFFLLFSIDLYFNLFLFSFFK